MLTHRLSESAELAMPELGLSHRTPSQPEIEAAVRTLISAAGDNPDREGLVGTPARVARAYSEWFSGSAIDPAALLVPTLAEAGSSRETTLLSNIPVISTCEHQMVPIIGVAQVGYRPLDRVVGTSKLSRLIDVLSRRLQSQERLTQQIGMTLWEVLEPSGVAVVIDATHGYMARAGVSERGVTVRTECWLGDFREDDDLRRDFAASIISTSKGAR